MWNEQTTVREVMSSSPITISGELSLDDARQRMHDHQIRHLPVFDGGHLVGLVSQRDLGVIGSIPGVNPSKLAVREAMSSKPYTVSPDDKLGGVVEMMASRKIGAAVVTEGGAVVGMFTTIDALHTLHRML